MLEVVYRLEWIHNGEVIDGFDEEGLLDGMDRMRAHPGSRLVRESDSTVIATTRAPTTHRPFRLRTLDSQAN